MSTIEQEFHERAGRIPHHGLGLSVDVYQPDLFELAGVLDRRGLPYGYLEIFKAAPAALESVRRRLPRARFAYHAEGIWVTQPHPERLAPFEADLDDTAEQLKILGSHWLNHECAAKQMTGHAFGTYLPALFTRASAAVTAENIARAQQRLDRDGEGPLFLLETPPLTYVGFGDLTMPEYFRLVTEQTPCGVVLDVGHVWTVYRYTGVWRRQSLTEFLAWFLDAFPLERVVEIHMAGLAVHPSLPASQSAAEPPFWLDAHGEPIPEVLAAMLAQVLDHRGLTHLKGVALEVDTKPIPAIAEEFTIAHERFGPRMARDWRETRDSNRANQARPAGHEGVASPATPAGLASLADQYDCYARIMTGRAAAGLPVLGGDASSLALYIDHYLPYEILEWGGAVRDMFPETCRLLDEAGVNLNDFVRFWFREPRMTGQSYDFFLLKIERFVEFVHEALPDAIETAEREADSLRSGYEAACEQVGSQA
jgi:hypothetical protein